MVIKETNGGETMASSKGTSGKMKGAPASQNKAVIVGQEIRFARALAGNDPKLRSKVLKNLKTWLTTRSQSTFAFSDEDFMRLWKGLFFCMWMSDKPLVQEELAESVGTLIRCFDENVPVALQFYKAFMATMGLEWFGIDRWRMDKFMMFIRRVTRQMLFVVHGSDWQMEHVKLLADIIDTTILNQDMCPYGLTNHFNDLILEEIAKVSDGTVPKEAVTQIIEPYVRYMLKNDDSTLIGGIVKNIFYALMQQSDLGQMYEEKFELWKKTNFVTGDIDSVQFNIEYNDDDDDGEVNEDEEEDVDEEEAEEEGKEEDAGKEVLEQENEEDDEGKEKVYDPRAGRVSVEIPQIDFDVQEIISLFDKHRFKPYATSQGKKSATLLLRKLTKFTSGVYPLGIKHVPSINPKDYEVDIDEQVEDLDEFHQKLYADKPKSFKELKREKRLKRKLLNEQKRAAKAAAEDDTPRADDDTIAKNGAQDESDAPEGAAEKKSTAKKKAKLRKKSPAAMKKQLKLEVLKKKRQAKLLLLKERLKAQKKPEPPATNGTAVSAEGEHLSTDSSVKQPEPPQSSGKKGTAEVVTVKKQQPPKDKKVTKNNADKPFQTADEWSEPLKEGEEEYFIPSRKLKTKQTATATSDASPAPTPVKLSAGNKQSLKRTPPSAGPSSDIDPLTPARKRVKIALNKNVAQDLVEHIQQVKSSPQLPFDSSRKPSKSLLKPNLIPSPINPFYKKKIGLK
ncbi:LOW QUALITY PROTEIN: ribosomal RNA processing protein 1 homolog [Anopheles ziemanni]|uniref:LOW QUALITY PROTEIN: ribosomal RNA processing protein 1 homolog n=1 Tax=Anopheles coustani TaxID=139045 RepID=UPI0026593C4A|nr:LOW QUALITY PROTEIN: ribosomal RNA processing protein 1 homolog [Anopheles coustani]XP_058171392.1 LOW QUALITY PROTEIN: ribosomal RNA processing protein 1 homolog [Anopheles ziemanni]